MGWDNKNQILVSAKDCDSALSISLAPSPWGGGGAYNNGKLTNTNWFTDTVQRGLG